MNIKKQFSSILVFVGLAMPLIALAVPPLVPCTSPDSLGGVACTLCQGVTLIQNIINYAIMLSFPVATLLFAYAGFKYFTSGANPATLERTHQIFKATAIGFFFVLGGWLIVNTILHTVIGANSSVFQNSSWFSVGQCTGNRPTQETVQHWLGGLFSTNPTITPVTNGAFICTTGAAYDNASGKCSDGSAPIQPFVSVNQGNCDSSTGQLYDPSSSKCVGGYTGQGCPDGTWGDYETGKCATTCSGGQQYDWYTGNCTNIAACNSSEDACTSSNGRENTAANATAAAAAAYADTNNKGAYQSGFSDCLSFVRLDLYNGGFDCAKNGMGQNGTGLMQSCGFQPLASGTTVAGSNAPPSGYSPQPGDVVNLLYNGHSHWEIYSAAGNWISDGVQKGFNVYSGQPTDQYTVYRHP